MKAAVLITTIFVTSLLAAGRKKINIRKSCHNRKINIQKRDSKKYTITRTHHNIPITMTSHTINKLRNNKKAGIQIIDMKNHNMSQLPDNRNIVIQNVHLKTFTQSQNSMTVAIQKDSEKNHTNLRDYWTVPIQNNEAENLTELKPAQRQALRLDFSGDIRKKLAFEVIKSRREMDTIVSPLLALIPIAMLSLKAEGEVLEEMLKALGYDSVEEMKKHFLAMADNYGPFSSSRVAVTSEIYMDTESPMFDTFLTDVFEFFDSAFTWLQYTDPTSSEKIVNKRIVEETQDRVRNVVGSSDLPKEKHHFMIVNTINFQVRHKNPFPLVSWSPFEGKPTSRYVSGLLATNPDRVFPYRNSATLEAHIIEIPSQENNVRLLLFRPFDGTDVLTVVNNIKNNLEAFNEEIGSLSPQLMSIQFPHIEINSTLDLRETYKKIGLDKIFEPGAFKNISEKALKLTNIMQKTMIRVNVWSSLGAAALPSILRQRNPSPSRRTNHIEFYRPFFYMITSKEEIMLAGTFYANEEDRRPYPVLFNYLL